MYKNMKKQRGFSLLEIIIAISLLMILISATQPIIGRLIDFRSNILTETNINILGDGVREWYSQNAWEFGQAEDSVLSLPDSGNITHNSGTIGDGWERLSINSAGSINYLKDGYGHSYRVFVSDPQVQEYRGVLVPYHTIALVSSNGNAEVIDDELVSEVASNFDKATGKITINNNESVYIVNGFSVQKENIDISIDRIERIARNYETFYRTNFSTKEREPAINYFANNGTDPRWDVSSPVAARCGGTTDTIKTYNQLGHSILSYNLIQNIGISSDAALSAWGEEFRLLNCGSTSNIRVNGVTKTFTARTPNDPPPFSAILGFHLPNGETYTSTVTSSL